MNVFLPIFIFPSITLGHKTTFYTNEEKVIVEAPRKLMQQLIASCDGTRTKEEIIQYLEKEWDREETNKLIKALHQKKILIDARRIGEKTWENMKNPSRFPNHITDIDVARLTQEAGKRHCSNPTKTAYQISANSFSSLLKRRQSTRSFSGDPVAFQSIVNMLWNGYGRLNLQENNRWRKTVPSAGALYPLTIHIALFKETDDLQPGIYSVYLGSPESIGFNLTSIDTLQFSRAFLGHLMFGKAHGIIVISGSFRIAGKKYGNRNMPYVLLEAGHVAQNINVTAIEHDVATVEIGGFVDNLLASAINLSKHYHPLITIAFGEKMEESENKDSNKKTEVQWATFADERYCPPFTIVSARVSKEIGWSNGRDASPIMAYTKAVAEAKEWAACGCIPDNLISTQFSDLKTAIDPRSIIKFHPAQYRLKRFPFKKFDEKTEYAWTEGYNEKTGSVAHILADLVYFPYFPKTPYYAYANSSGVAAHPDRQKAVEISTLELVERDSFMIAYFTQLEFPTVQERTLPKLIRKRIRELNKIGFQVWIKDHSLDLTPVVCVSAQSEKLTYTPCASCASFDTEHAVNHALMEVEALILARLQEKPTPIKPSEIMWPLDHAKLYGQKHYFRRANFMISGQDRISFQDIGKNTAQSWQELVNRFTIKGWQHFTIPLYLSKKYGGNNDLHIIRSIVPGMIPMTFGYRQEPAGMKRIYKIVEEIGNKSISYRDLTKFPHPFA